MDVHSQIIFSSDGQPTSVVIPFDEWQQLTDAMPVTITEQVSLETRRRLMSYRTHPETATSLEDFLQQLDKEDAEEA